MLVGSLLLALLLALGIISAGIANILFFWMQDKLVEEGIPAKEFFFPGDVYRTLKNYHTKARLKGWSLLPLFSFLFTASVAFVCALGFVIAVQFLLTK